MKISPIQGLQLGMISIATFALGFSPATLAKAAVKPATAAAVAIAAPTPTYLPWCDDLRSALSSAQSNRRWVLVDMYTEHCGWCKRLDADTFSNPGVIKMLANHFVWVKCDAENENKGTWVKDKYQPEGYPCILILDPYGTEKGRIMGYLPPQAFVSRVAGIIRR